jgi:hypothetical protein
MLVEENEFRQSLQVVIKGILTIFGLWLLRALVSGFLGETPVLGNLSVSTIFCSVISVSIAGVLIRLYSPARNMATYYLEVMVQSGKMPGDDKHLEHLIAVAGKITALIFLSMVYECLLPVIVAINESFIHFNILVTVLNVIIGIIVVGMLIMTWRQAQPIFDDVSGHIADNVARMSTGTPYKHCPSCKARNDKDVKFCTSCGTKMEPERAVRASPNKILCAKCETVNMPYAKFCYQCGNTLH